jgi:hypothetical protein
MLQTGKKLVFVDLRQSKPHVAPRMSLRAPKQIRSSTAAALTVGLSVLCGNLNCFAKLCQGCGSDNHCEKAADTRVIYQPFRKIQRKGTHIRLFGWLWQFGQDYVPNSPNHKISFTGNAISRAELWRRLRAGCAEKSCDSLAKTVLFAEEMFQKDK